MIYEHKQERELTKSEYEAALELFPDFNEAKNALKELKK